MILCPRKEFLKKVIQVFLIASSPDSCQTPFLKITPSMACELLATKERAKFKACSNHFLVMVMMRLLTSHNSEVKDNADNEG